MYSITPITAGQELYSADLRYLFLANLFARYQKQYHNKPIKLPLNFISNSSVTVDWYLKNKKDGNLLLEHEEETGEELKLNTQARIQDILHALSSLDCFTYTKDSLEVDVEIFCKNTFEQLYNRDIVTFDQTLKQWVIDFQKDKDEIKQYIENLEIYPIDAYGDYKMLLLQELDQATTSWVISSSTFNTSGIAMETFYTPYQKIVGNQVVQLAHIENRVFTSEFVSALSHTNWTDVVSYIVHINVKHGPAFQEVWETKFQITNKEFNHYLSLDLPFREEGYITYLAQQYIPLEEKFGSVSEYLTVNTSKLNSVSDYGNITSTSGSILSPYNKSGYKVEFKNIEQKIIENVSKPTVSIQRVSNSVLNNLILSYYLNRIGLNNLPLFKEIVVIGDSSSNDVVEKDLVTDPTTAICALIRNTSKNDAQYFLNNIKYIRDEFKDWKQYLESENYTETEASEQHTAFYDWYRLDGNSWPVNDEDLPFELDFHPNCVNTIESALDSYNIAIPNIMLENYVNGMLEEINDQRNKFNDNTEAYNYLYTIWKKIEIYLSLFMLDN